MDDLAIARTRDSKEESGFGTASRASTAAESRTQNAWSRRGFLGALGAVAVGSMTGCAAGADDSQSVLGWAAGGGSGRRSTPGPRVGADQPLRPTKPYQLTSSCELSEDHFLVQNHLVEPDKDTVVAYSRSDGQVEAIVLQDGIVKQAYRDSSQPGGWQVNPLPDADQVTQMVAGVSAPVALVGSAARAAALEVFYVKSGSDQLWVASQTLLDGTPSTTFKTQHVAWTTEAPELKIALNVDNSLLVTAMRSSASADSGDAQLWFCSDSGSSSTAPDRLVSGSLTGFSYDPARNGRWAAAVGSSLEFNVYTRTLFLYLPGGIDDEGNEDRTLHVWTALLKSGSARATSSDARFDGGLQPPQGEMVIVDVACLATLGARQVPTALIWTERSIEGGRAGNPRLWAVTWDPMASGVGWIWTELVLPSSITAAPSAITVSTALTPRSQKPKDMFGATQLLDVFVVFDDTLHVLRQVEQADAVADVLRPVYTPLIPLQPGVAMMSSQAAVSTGNELMIVGTDRVLQTLEKDPVSGRWTDAELQLPATSLQQDSAYRVTLTLTDVAWNVPVAGQALTITASTSAPATIEAPTGTSTVLVGPDPVRVTTDADGEVMLALLADGLSAPTLTITADGLDAPVTVHPSAAVNAYLTGDPKQKLNYLDPLSSSTLKDAKTLSGQLVAPGAADQKTADQAVAAMTQAATMGSKGAALGRASSTVGRVDGGRAHLAGRHRRDGHRPGVGSAVGTKGLTGSINNWAHDALHAIKKGAVAVDHFVIDTAHQVVQIAGDFVNWTDNLLEIIIHGIEDAAHVLHAAFNKLAADIVHVVKWLEAEVVGLLRDSAAVAGYLGKWLDQGCTFLGSSIAQEKAAADAWLNREHSALKKRFDAIVAGYGPGTTLDNMATNPPLAVGSRRRLLPRLGKPRPGPSSAGSMGEDADDQSSPHSDWFFRKVKHAISGGGLQTPDLGLDVVALFESLAKAAATAIGDFARAFRDFATWLNTVITHPSEAGTVGVAKLLTCVSDMLDGVFVLAKAVVDTVFDLFAALAKVLTSMLTTDLGSIAIIGELFKLAGLGKMHIGSVVNMLFAFPATLGYKIKHGSHSRPFAALGPAEGVRHQLGDAAGDLKEVAEFVMGEWAVFDGVAAVYLASKKEPPLYIAAIDIASPIILTALTAPTNDGGEPVFAAPVSKDNKDVLGFFSWILGTIPAFCAAAGIYVDQALHTKKFDDKAADSIKDALAWIMGGGGVFSLVTGVLATSLEEPPSGAEYAVAVLNNVAPTASPALTTQVVEDTEGWSAGIVVALTIACGVGGAAAYSAT